MRIVPGIALVIALCLTACTSGSTPAAPSTGATSAVDSQPRSSVADTISLRCSDPIDTLPAPTSPQHSILGTVGLDTSSTAQANGAVSAGSTDPHRLFAKTPLLIHVGREATLALPADWTSRVSIAWGNHAAEWTAVLRIPACPAGTSGHDQWLVFPGGFSLDAPACVPLQIRVGNKLSTVHVPVGTRCPSRPAS